MTYLLDKIKQPFLVLFLLSVIISSCDKEDEEEESSDTASFRTEMLKDVADNLIIPNFEILSSDVNSLHNSIESFNKNPNEQNLLDVRTKWKSAVKSHQHCSAFGFGPGSLLLGPYANVLGVFPVDESEVEDNILIDDFDLANSFSVDIRGFYTIEYLIWRDGLTNQEVINSFDQNRKDYLLLVSTELKTTFDEIVAEWGSGYRSDFVNNNGTAAGSSLSLYYNEFVKDYENLKNFKLELPAGLSAGQTNSDPTLVEAYYSGISTELIEEHWKSNSNIWSGTSKSGSNIKGFEEYLDIIVGGPNLAEQTNNSISEIDKLVLDLPDVLSENLDSKVVSDLRDKLQDNTANFKSSLSSLLGISITFNSGDGD